MQYDTNLTDCHTHATTPPFGGRNFWQNQAGRLHHEVAPICLYYDLANIVKNGCKDLSRL